MEVMAGIHQLKLPIPDNPLGYLNAYLIRGGNGYTLVDSGWPTQETLDVLIKELGAINLNLQDITSIVITHAHPDHLGLAGKIRELSKAEIIMHELEASHITPEHWKADTQWWDWLLANGMLEEDVLKLQERDWGREDFLWRVQPDRMVSGGEKLSLDSADLEVIWSPGHSVGHICLYEPARKILFSGDHILPVITPNVSLFARSAANPLGSYIDSLKKMERLEVELVLPGHEHIFGNFRERVQQILEHHAQRIEELLDALGSEEKTAYQIASKMLWVGIAEVVLGENLPITQQIGALGETLAHLEFLRVEGRVERVIKNGMAFFHANVSNARLRFA